MQVSPCGRPRLGLLSTLGTLESLRPPTLLKIAAARRVISKPVHELLIGPRIVGSRLGPRSVVHACQHYTLAPLASSGDPLRRIPFCRAGAGSARQPESNALPITNLRYVLRVQDTSPNLRPRPLSRPVGSGVVCGCWASWP
jgi:hypothetical protein